MPFSDNFVSVTLKDKSVLITGGTGQLGRVVAESFVAQDARVATSYIFEEELKRLPGDFKKKILLSYANVADEQSVAALFHQVIKNHGSVDILINIVGGFLPRATIADTQTKDWDLMMEINLKSAFLCSREFLRGIKGKSYGRIISMAAMPAISPTAGRGPYAVSKTGVVVLTKVLGEELKGTGVTANAIAPSILRTQANMESMPNEDFNKWVTPEEIAEMMLFLCSENGKSINGVTIPIFGGI